MCFPYDARPPIPPIAGAAIDTRRLTLTSRDGTRFLAFAARSATPSGAGVVVLPDVRGLFPFYEELAERFAERSIDAIAIDYFGRTAGTKGRSESFAFMDHVAQTKAPQISDDVAAAVAYLRSADGGACRSIFTVGFCFGGSNSWQQAANGHGLAGVVGFYGGLGPRRDSSPGPIERAAGYACPLLGLMAGDDKGIPPEKVTEFDAALTSAGIEHEIITYEGTPHSFLDRSFEQYAEASADAWQRVLGFIAKHA